MAYSSCSCLEILYLEAVFSAQLPWNMDRWCKTAKNMAALRHCWKQVYIQQHKGFSSADPCFNTVAEIYYCQVNVIFVRFLPLPDEQKHIINMYIPCDSDHKHQSIHQTQSHPVSIINVSIIQCFTSWILKKNCPHIKKTKFALWEITHITITLSSTFP